jgi:toxin FitB
VIILDTNVLSALMRKEPDLQVGDWLDRQPRSSIWITSITVLEIRYGLQILPAGKRRTTLEEAFEELTDRLGQRIAEFDAAAGKLAGDLMAARHKRGRPVVFRDTMIAGITLAHNATLATRNTVHFEDTKISLINPWAV